MEEENTHEPIEKSSHMVRFYLAKGCSLITTVVYLLIAVLLVFAVVIAAVDAVELLIEAMASTDVAALTPAVQEILFIIVLATLIDLVRSYVKYGKILLRPILVAGITGPETAGGKSDLCGYHWCCHRHPGTHGLHYLPRT